MKKYIFLLYREITVHISITQPATMFKSLPMIKIQCPLLHFQASPIALILQACTRLGDVSRIRSTRGDLAAEEVTLLLALFRRHRGIPDAPISTPRKYSNVFRFVEETPTLVLMS